MKTVDFTELFDKDSTDFIDLTHPMKAGMPVWPTHPAFCQEVVESYERGDVACNHALCLSEHSGTHFDAPKHWITGKDFPDGATDTIPVKNFVAPVNVIDCSKESAADSDFLLTVDHIKDWEAEHGAINPGEWVVMRTDWYKRNGSEAEARISARRLRRSSMEWLRQSFLPSWRRSKR